MSGMGVLFDYFAADSNEAPASVIDRRGGPGSSATCPALSITPRRRLFRRSTGQAPAPRDNATELVAEDVGKDADHVREFHNYIHPGQQLKEDFQPRAGTAQIARQVLRAAIDDLSRLSNGF